MDEKALGKKLQLARKRAGLTQQELCQKAGLSYSTLAKIERGAIRSPSVFTVAAIAHATNTPLENLLDIPQAPGIGTQDSKKRSKSGVTFVYFDVNGVLVRFFHKAFSQIAELTSMPSDMIETIFWRHHDAVSCSQMSLDEFNSILGKEFDIPDFNWQDYYDHNVESMPGIKEIVDWAAQNYSVGLLTDSMPGSVDRLLRESKIPQESYTAIVDSSKTGVLKPDPKIYEIAQQMASVDPSEILLIDDDRANLIAADKAGWHVLWFDDFEPQESIARIKAALEF